MPDSASSSTTAPGTVRAAIYVRPTEPTGLVHAIRRQQEACQAAAAQNSWEVEGGTQVCVSSSRAPSAAHLMEWLRREQLELGPIARLVVEDTMILADDSPGLVEVVEQLRIIGVSVFVVAWGKEIGLVQAESGLLPVPKEMA